jgi:hypothetical protein
MVETVAMNRAAESGLEAIEYSGTMLSPGRDDIAFTTPDPEESLEKSAKEKLLKASSNPPFAECACVLISLSGEILYGQRPAVHAV